MMRLCRVTGQVPVHVAAELLELQACSCSWSGGPGVALPGPAQLRPPSGPALSVRLRALGSTRQWLV